MMDCSAASCLRVSPLVRIASNQGVTVVFSPQNQKRVQWDQVFIIFVLINPEHS